MRNISACALRGTVKQSCGTKCERLGSGGNHAAERKKSRQKSVPRMWYISNVKKPHMVAGNVSDSKMFSYCGTSVCWTDLCSK